MESAVVSLSLSVFCLVVFLLYQFLQMKGALVKCTTIINRILVLLLLRFSLHRPIMKKKICIVFIDF